MSLSPKTYRLVRFDRAQKILTADFIEAESDANAIALAQDDADAGTCEIWDGERLAAQLNAGALGPQSFRS